MTNEGYTIKFNIELLIASFPQHVATTAEQIVFTLALKELDQKLLRQAIILYAQENEFFPGSPATLIKRVKDIEAAQAMIEKQKREEKRRRCTFCDQLGTDQGGPDPRGHLSNPLG